MMKRTLRPSIFISCSLTAIILTASPARAVITVGGVSGASASENLTETTATIYGGLAGPLSRGTCAQLNADLTCDNCVSPAAAAPDDNLVACNSARVHPALRLVIDLSSSTVESGTPVITDSTDVAITVNETPTKVAKGESGRLVILWSTICSRFDATGGGALCDPTAAGFNGQVKVGIDADGDGLLKSTGDDSKNISIKVQEEIGQGTGDVSHHKDCANTDSDEAICYFELVSGDKKASLATIDGAGGFPNGGNIQFRSIRFLCSPTSFAAITPEMVCAEATIEGQDVEDFSLSSRKIGGLTNDLTYYFKVAAVDRAGNVGFYTPSTLDEDCLVLDVNGNKTCHVARPGEVLGVLADDVNCFVATAAWRSDLEPRVATLRHFRDRYLKTNAAGRAFIKIYYEHGPKLARWIAKSEWMRRLSRTILWPFAGFALLALNLGFVQALGIVMTAFAAIGWAALALYRRTMKRDITLG